MENNKNTNQGSAQRSKKGSGNFRNDPQRAVDAGRKGGLASRSNKNNNQ